MGLLERCAEAYFRPKAWERRGELYEWMGVRGFQRLLVGAARKDVQKSQRTSSYLLQDRTPESLRAFEQGTRRNELVHLIAMVPALLGLLAGGFGSTTVSVLLFVVLAVNLHPLILQRYNRIRLLRVLARRSGAGS